MPSVASSLPAMAVGAPHDALGEFSLDALPRAATSHHDADFPLLERRIKMVEVQYENVGLAAVATRMREQIVGEQLPRPLNHRFLVAGSVGLVHCTVVDVPLPGTLAAPRLKAVGGGTSLVELPDGPPLLTGRADLEQAFSPLANQAPATLGTTADSSGRRAHAEALPRFTSETWSFRTIPTQSRTPDNS